MTGTTGILDWIGVHALQIFLLALAALFFVVLMFSRKAAWSYARITTLIVVGTVMMMPPLALVSRHLPASLV